MKNSKTKTKLSFKKIMSMILSIMMILSMTAGVDFSAFADEETVESISFELADGFTVSENTNGEYEGCEEGHDHDQFFRYYTWPLLAHEGNKLTVNYSTGTTKVFIYQWVHDEDEDCGNLFFVSEDGEIIDDDCIDVYSYQWIDHWGIGKDNELTIEYEGVSTTVNVSIVENPIASIGFEFADGFTVSENTNGWYNNCNENHEHDKYYEYNLSDVVNKEGNTLIINYKTGDTKEFTCQWVYDEDEDCSYLFFASEDGELINDDYINMHSYQWMNHWGVGKDNELTIEYEGVSTTVNVPIGENPIASIGFELVDGFALTENTNGWYNDCYQEHDHDHDEYYHYYAWDIIQQEGDKLTVNYKTGDTKVYIYQKVYDEYDDWDYFYVAEDGETLDRYILEFYDYQSENHWGVGKDNELTIEYQGAFTTINVPIVENPVDHIEVLLDNPIVLIENVDGYRQECEVEGHDHSRYFHYEWSIFNKGNKIVVYSKDGTETEYEFDYDEDDAPCFIAKNGDTISQIDLDYYDYQYREHWEETGTYEAYVEYFGARCPIEVNIVESQVKSISFTPAQPIEYKENDYGYWQDCYEHDHRYFDYEIKRFNKGDILTVTYKDGTTLDFVYRTNRESWYGTFRTDDGEEIDERYVNVISNQYENHWSVGNDNYYTIETFGQSCDVQVTIVESPVASVEFVTDSPITYYENHNGYYGDDEYSDVFYYTDYYRAFRAEGNKVVVHYKDGTDKVYTCVADDGYYNYKSFVDEEGNRLEYALDAYQWDEPWTVGSDNYMVLTVEGVECLVPVTIKEDNIVDFEYIPVNKFSFIENTNGYWDDEEEVPFYYYFFNFEDGDQIVVTYDDETTKTFTVNAYRGEYTEYEFVADNGDGTYEKHSMVDDDGEDVNYLFKITTNQWENHWTPDTENHVTIYVGDVEKSYPVEIKKNEIGSVEFVKTNKTVYVENTNGYWESFEGSGAKKYIYDVPLFEKGDKFVVTYNDSTVKNYVCIGVDEEDIVTFVNEDGDTILYNRWDYINGLLYTESDQWNEPWILGENTYDIYFYGVKTQGTVTIVPCEHKYVYGICSICGYDSGEGYETIELGTREINITNGNIKKRFYFTPKASGTYLFKANDEKNENGEIYDTVGAIYDMDGRELARNDDYDDLLSFGVECELIKGQTYILEAGMLYSNETGSFTVTLGEAFHSYTKTTEAATCIADGKITYTCEICGASYTQTLDIDPENHADVEKWVTTADNHKKAYACCGEIAYEEEAHSFNEQGICDICGYGCEHTGGTATCNSLAVCDKCGAEYGSLNPENHNYSTKTYTATCEAQGYTVYTCDRCGDTYTADFVDPLGHNYSAWKSNGNGTHTKTCQNDRRHQITSDCDGGTATCNQRPVCADCNMAYGRVDSKNHTVVIDKAKPVTCTENGLTEGSHCSACGTVFTEQEVINAKGHSYTVNTVNPTCTSGGYTVHTCDSCGNSYTDNYTNALSHNYSAYTVNATCTAGGYTVHTCINCGNSYTDNYTNALGHNYSAYTVNATCTSGGYTVYTCYCGASYVADYTNAFGHSFGTNNKTCANCGTANPTYDAKKPAKPTISKVTAGKKKFKVTVKKVSKARKYEIQYSTSKNFKGAKTVTITGTSKEITKLSAKKKYYVRVRSVNNAGKSAWSATKTVTTKK